MKRVGFKSLSEKTFFYRPELACPQKQVKTGGYVSALLIFEISHFYTRNEKAPQVSFQLFCPFFLSFTHFSGSFQSINSRQGSFDASLPFPSLHQSFPEGGGGSKYREGCGENQREKSGGFKRGWLRGVRIKVEHTLFTFQ